MNHHPDIVVAVARDRQATLRAEAERAVRTTRRGARRARLLRALARLVPAARPVASTAQPPGSTLFMDVHTIAGGICANDVTDAHEADLATQAEFQVSYLRYWVNEAAGKVFCLIDAPDAESAIAVHRTAHGLVPDDIEPVTSPVRGTRRDDRASA